MTGVGAMPMSMGTNDQPAQERAIATVHAALDAGVTFIDTADIYAPAWDQMGHNERCWSDTGMNIYGNQDMQLFASGVEYFK